MHFQNFTAGFRSTPMIMKLPEHMSENDKPPFWGVMLLEGLDVNKHI